MPKKYHKKGRLIAGILLTCSLLILGVLFFINSIIFWLITRVGTPTEKAQQTIVTEETLSGPDEYSPPSATEPVPSPVAVLKNFINWMLGVLGLLAIPGTIVGIVLLATYKPKKRVLADGE